jgi:hypothetical protein
MAVQIHQLLHGYRSGHGQIGASTRLPDRDCELITRLSDLSGSLSSGLQLDSYLTVYPLPSRTFFAVARTWPDPEAPRAGCVLTHTILFPVEVWASYRNVRSVNSFFRNPRSSPDHNFTEPIRLPNGNPPCPPADLRLDLAASRNFVSRYFGKGIRPIVWFNADQPDEILWRLLEHLWPKLRSAFSCCTFSLQQRNLEEGPFDLLFAPSPVYSRFTKLSPEQLIESGSGRKNLLSEAWSEYWAEALFAPGRSMPMGENEISIWNELGEDPTAVRKLSLIQDLRHRAPQSATAGVGAIDVVESLAHEPTDAVDLKRVVLTEAIEAASTAPPEEALMSLRLIEDRLRRDSFRTLSEDFASHLASAAASVTTRGPEAALQSGGAWLADSLAGADSAVAHGIITGLRDLATKNPAQLEILRAAPDIAAEIFRMEPTFAATYLQVGGAAAPGILGEWLASTRDFETLRLVRKSVLPLLEQPQNEQLLVPLLRDLRAEDVGETLAILFTITQGFADSTVQTIVGGQISTAYPDVVRGWASTAATWSPGLAAVVASAYPPSRQGFDELLGDDSFNQRRKVEVLAAAIRNQVRAGHPYWLREIISNDVRLVRIVLLAGSEAVDTAASVLPLLLNEAELPLAKADDVLEAVQSFSGRPVFPQLFDAAMRSLITCYLVDGRDSPTVRKFEGSSEASGWLQNVSAPRLTDLLVQACYSGQLAIARAWKWIARTQRSLYQRRPPALPALCDALLRFSHQSFPEGMEESFVQVLTRSSSESDPEVRQALSAKMLRFALDHVGFPLGGVVAETFADAYAVAIEQDHRSSSIFSILFGQYNWDRGKDLRVAFIDAFLRSNWLPGDLAIAGNKAGILRKIFKRLHRRYGGDNYINSMVKDLETRNDLNASAAREQLLRMVNAPNFYEDWD